MKNYSKFHHKQKGVGLIEVLVSLLILAISVLGFVALQASSMEISDESVQRTQSLVLMRDIGEKIRANPIGVETYKTQLSTVLSTTPAAPTKTCGLVNSESIDIVADVAKLCTPAELAEAESYLFKKELAQSGYTIGMIPCPSVGTKVIADVMYSYCLISAWGDTNPTQTGAPTTPPTPPPSDGSIDCLDEDGAYYPNATCLLMELT